MNIAEFIEAIHHHRQPPKELPSLLRALWLDRKGHWDAAHSLTQDETGADAAWVHAYLHRKEGDLGNARYWYHRSGHGESHKTPEGEWQDIAEHLLEKTG